MKVAPRKTTSGYKGGHGCVICDLPEGSMQRVNAELWDGTSNRTRGYRARGVRAYFALTGKTIDVKTVTKHTEHIEDSWRDVDGNAVPANELEVPVYPSDYKSIVDRAANLGSFAMAKLEARMAKDRIEDRDLVTIAKSGVVARTQQEANRVADKKPQTQVALIFGLAGGHLAGELPEHEAIDVTPEQELLDEMATERQALEALTAGEQPSGDAGEEGFDDIFGG